MVRRQLVQRESLIPPTFLDWRLIPWRFKVLIFECERLAPLVAPRLHKSHCLAIFSKKQPSNMHQKTGFIGGRRFIKN